MIAFTIITSSCPATLAKTFSLTPGGSLKKSTIANLTEGTAESVSVMDLGGFAKRLSELKPNQALCFGLTGHDRIRLLSRERFREQGEPMDATTRTKEAMRWPSGPGILMLDHDAGDARAAFDRAALVNALAKVIPQFSDCGQVWWPSSSSHILNQDTEKDLTGLRGQRIYVGVVDASDIERAGHVLHERCWLEGLGWYEVGKAGQLLERSIIDRSVFQTNRLDFAAGASCAAPLIQRRGKPLLQNGQLLDTRIALPDLSAEEAIQLAAAKREARELLRERADKLRSDYVTETAKALAGVGADQDQIETAKQVITLMLDGGILDGIFTIHFADGSKATVSEILNDPQAFNGKEAFDPIEPDYDGGRPVAKLFTTGPRPIVNSFAHGGRVFELRRPLKRIELMKGHTRKATDETLAVLRDSPDTFDFGDALATVTEAHVHAHDVASLSHHLGGYFQFWRWGNGQNNITQVDADPPDRLCKAMIAIGPNVRKLKPLTGVITAPTMRLDGSIIDQPGYDSCSQLYLYIDEPSAPIDLNPTVDQVREALKELFFPFQDFPFVSAVDRGVFLSACLTALMRSTLPTAPGFGFDAPAQGAGKTLLASCCGALALGRSPDVWPHTSSSRDKDEEVRKRIFAALRGGCRVMLWDNVIGTFDSPALAAALTSPSYTDRLLGVSDCPAFPNRSMMLVTGNNLSITGDLMRRILVVRIDPRCERPYSRRFEFDPLTYVLAHRRRLIAAGLTVLRGWQIRRASLGAVAEGRTASFECWDDMVRQCVAWIGKEVDPGGFSDPMESVHAAYSADVTNEALAELLAELHRVFNDRPFTARELGLKLEGNDSKLSAAWTANSNDARSNLSIGRVLKNRRDRMAGAYVLMEAPRSASENVGRWRVVKRQDQLSGFTGDVGAVAG